GRLELGDMSTELWGELRRIGADIDRRLALARQVAAARIGPDYHREAVRLRLEPHLGDLFELPVSGVRAGIDRKTDCRGAEPQRVLDAGRHRLVGGLLLARQAVGAVGLQDQRNLPGIAARSRL